MCIWLINVLYSRLITRVLNEYVLRPINHYIHIMAGLLEYGSLAPVTNAFDVLPLHNGL